MISNFISAFSKNSHQQEEQKNLFQNFKDDIKNLKNTLKFKSEFIHKIIKRKIKSVYVISFLVSAAVMLLKFGSLTIVEYVFFSCAFTFFAGTGLIVFLVFMLGIFSCMGLEFSIEKIARLSKNYRHIEDNEKILYQSTTDMLENPTIQNQLINLLQTLEDSKKQFTSIDAINFSHDLETLIELLSKKDYINAHSFIITNLEHWEEAYNGLKEKNNDIKIKEDFLKSIKIQRYYTNETEKEIDFKSMF